MRIFKKPTKEDIEYRIALIKELSNKHQAPSVKQQILKNKLHKPGTRVKNRFHRKV